VLPAVLSRPLHADERERRRPGQLAPVWPPPGCRGGRHAEHPPGHRHRDCPSAPPAVDQGAPVGL